MRTKPKLIFLITNTLASDELLASLMRSVTLTISMHADTHTSTHSLIPFQMFIKYIYTRSGVILPFGRDMYGHTVADSGLV